MPIEGMRVTRRVMMIVKMETIVVMMMTMTPQVQMRSECDFLFLFATQIME